MNMPCNDAELLLIDYLDNQLSNTSKKSLGQHLQGCVQCSRQLAEYRELFQSIAAQKTEKPGPALRDNFNSMLQSEINMLATARIIEPTMKKTASVHSLTGFLVKVAACLILLAGGIILGTSVTGQRNAENIAQVTALRREVKAMKEAMIFSLLADESASERIKAISYAEQMSDPGQGIITALIRTLNLDQNVNVRLAALGSVSKFSSNQVIRDSLVNSLRFQQEPIVQIVLINILTDRKEKRAVDAIKEIISNKTTLAPVKDAAEKGLKLL
jgi:hypothetical protein